MTLPASALRPSGGAPSGPDESAARLCALALEFETAGNYEGARGALGDFWRGVGERPPLDGLGPAACAEMLLRVGTLSGWLGSAGRAVCAQDAAKDLICESLRLFESLPDDAGAARARAELAWCYFREGALDETRVLLREAMGRLPQGDELSLTASIRLADVERAAGNYEEALRVLDQAGPEVAACPSDSLKGKFHSTRAGVLEAQGFRGGTREQTDRALIELAAASFHFERAGHLRYKGRVENNLGFLLYRLGRYEEAETHLGRARRLFVSLREEASVAQVDETRARALLARGRRAEAERVLTTAVRALERRDEQGLLLEALVSLGAAQQLLGRGDSAAESFARAAELGRILCDDHAAGRALLTVLEESLPGLKQEELRGLYLRADGLLEGADSAETLARLRQCARRLIAPPASRPGAESRAPVFVHDSAESESLLGEARCVAASDSPVLLTGETGTGKEVLARLIHEWSGRAGRFVAVNCAALCESLFESQVFGHRRGSFTDAVFDYAGLAREAEGGTLYLDEVGELSPANQAKLLRLVGHGEVSQLGSSGVGSADVRILAATNRPLGPKVAGGLFRPDLYYRLTAFQLFLPPLRERTADIPALARHFASEFSRRYQKRVAFAPDSFEAMARLPLAGNARELRSLIERTFLTSAEGAVVTAAQVEAAALRQGGSADLSEPWQGCSLDEEVRVFEGRLIRAALEEAKGSLTRAARLLGVTHQGLAYILKGRHKDLLPARKPARRRRVSIIKREPRATRPTS
jgi:transcriptional regulator with GAF, ATPase, and Fis domain